jgi:hypothetical protein
MQNGIVSNSVDPEETYHGNKMPVFIIRAGAPDVAQKTVQTPPRRQALDGWILEQKALEHAGTKGGTC